MYNQNQQGVSLMASHISVNGTQITVTKIEDKDYISLTIC